VNEKRGSNVREQRERVKKESGSSVNEKRRRDVRYRRSIVNKKRGSNVREQRARVKKGSGSSVNKRGRDVRWRWPEVQQQRARCGRSVRSSSQHL
jgi:hypothetical protein